MYAVTVELRIDPSRVAEFLSLMLDNARCSREHESGCRQFDVCSDRDCSDVVFLYELYDDRAAFETHLASEHFRTFDASTRNLVFAKTVRFWERLAP